MFPSLAPILVLAHHAGTSFAVSSSIEGERCCGDEARKSIAGTADDDYGHETTSEPHIQASASLTCVNALGSVFVMHCSEAAQKLADSSAWALRFRRAFEASRDFVA